MLNVSNLPDCGCKTISINTFTDTIRHFVEQTIHFLSTNSTVYYLMKLISLRKNLGAKGKKKRAFSFRFHSTEMVFF